MQFHKNWNFKLKTKKIKKKVSATYEYTFKTISSDKHSIQGWVGGGRRRRMVQPLRAARKNDQ